MSLSDGIIACWDAGGKRSYPGTGTTWYDMVGGNDADLDNDSSRGRTTHLFYSGNNSTFDNSSTPDSKLYDNSSSGISATSISAAGNSMTLTITK